MVASLVGLGIAGLSAAIGAAQSAKQSEQAEQEMTAERNRQRAWYNRKYNEDYTSRTDMQQLFAKQRDVLNEQYKRARGASSVVGASDSFLAAQKQANAIAAANAMSDVAAAAAGYKDNLSSADNAAQANYSNRIASIRDRQAQSAREAGAAGVNAGAQMIAADDNNAWGFLFKKKA